MPFMRALQRPNQIGKEHGDAFGKGFAEFGGNVVKGGYFLRDEYRKDKAMETMAKEKKEKKEERKINDASRYTADKKF